MHATSIFWNIDMDSSESNEYMFQLTLPENTGVTHMIYLIRKTEWYILEDFQ